MIVDVHCHLHEYSDQQIRKFFDKVRGLIVVAVSDDPASSRATLRLHEAFGERVIPCVGIHPWEAGKVSEAGLGELERLVSKQESVRCVGEVGLDKKFVPETLDRQMKVFKKLVLYAREYGAVLNVHAAGAWREVLEVLVTNDVDKALIHWYTGPKDVLAELVSLGYFVSINPAVKVQRKHQEIAAAAPLKAVLMESDGPYNYRGMELSPLLLPELVKYLANVKNVSEKSLLTVLETNFRRLFNSRLR